MKINFKHPATGKPSTVIIAPWWVDLWQETEPDETIQAIVQRLASVFLNPQTLDLPHHQYGVPKTFTQRVEQFLAGQVTLYLARLRYDATTAKGRNRRALGNDLSPDASAPEA